MTAHDLLDHIAALGIARPRAALPGTDRALVVGPIEVARAERASDSFMRARWRERVRTGGAAYLLIADEPRETGRIRVLGPTSAKRPIHSVRGELLADALHRSAGLPALDAVRRIAADLTRMTGDGLDVNGLLTRHTLEHRLRGDPSRWDEAADLTRSLRSTDNWRSLFGKLGYAVEQLPDRGYLARAGGAPVAVIHPKRTASELGHTDRQGRPPEGLLLEDCETQGAPFGVLAHGGRFRLFNARSESPASEWLELDLRLLGAERRHYLALLSPRYLAQGGFADLRAEARNFGVELHRRLDRTIRQDALPGAGHRDAAVGEGERDVPRRRRRARGAGARCTHARLPGGLHPLLRERPTPPDGQPGLRESVAVLAGPRG